MANQQHFVQACNNINPSQMVVWSDLVADLTALRAAHLAMAAKLDLDAGVTDTNYAALTNPAALKTRLK